MSRANGNGTAWVASPNWIPPAISDDVRCEIKTAIIPKFEAFLLPADRRALGLKIPTLLAHYYVPDMEPQFQRLIAADWLRLLAPYPLPVLAAVMDDWLRQFRHRPTIADLIENCETLVARPRVQLALMKQIVENDRDAA